MQWGRPDWLAASPDAAFSGVNPAHWYVASYLTVVIAATGLFAAPAGCPRAAQRGNDRSSCWHARPVLALGAMHREQLPERGSAV
jgi:hypothetical protein